MFAAVEKPLIEERLERYFFGWLAISVRWPEARRAFQYLLVHPSLDWKDYLGMLGVADAKSDGVAVLDTLRNLRFKALGEDGAFRAFMLNVFQHVTN